eukprot:Hpha_TRINITY_DN23183_c0_g1::TRINITY_DN23183_c0_g1_i1::g.29612::m.29612/K13941/folKP; 2-amino-4-hydroxy-6-hydroxymethyldihydropteridine diphosphokinase / dihydropteroate synthase
MHRVFVALGSNLGHRVGALNRAIKELQKLGNVRRTSYLYESQPMYVEAQPPFLNAVVELQTGAAPLDLLRGLKGIEGELGRVPTTRFGPRCIDLDILFYDEEVISHGELLHVPHVRFAEREFVLRPLLDVAPARMVDPKSGRPLEEFLAELPPPTCHRVLPSSWRAVEGRAEVWPHKRTLVMGILNVTPDSFSDGGTYSGVEAAVRRAAEMVEEGVDVLDIGGESTRPGATPVGEKEEAARVVPVIRAMREAGLEIPISVDTMKGSVARAALEAGADIVNDVSAGEETMRVAAEFGAPLVVMHMRGTPIDMQSHAQYADLLGEVISELGGRVVRAQDLGVPLWGLVADPGLGFAKTAEHNLLLLQRLGRLGEGLGLPLLVGASRKGFIGKLTG